MEKKKYIVVIVGIIIVVLGALFYVYHDSLWLKKEGWTSAEISALESLNTQDQDYFKKHPEIRKILQENDYQADKLSRYIALHRNPYRLTVKQILLYVNQDYDTLGINFTTSNIAFLEHEDFDKEKIKRYIAYRKENPNAPTDAVIKIVNQDIDSVVAAYDDFILLLIQEPYFKKDYITRYLDYEASHNTSANDTVTYVNANRDKTYYSSPVLANTSFGNLILVNKYYQLDKSFVPSDLVTTDSKYNSTGTTLQLKKEVYEAFVKMEQDIEKEGMKLQLNSLYRSYDKQKSLYQDYKKKDGEALADTYSARPGFSEHQTGLAIDMTTPSSTFQSFEFTEAYAWLQDNAHKYGFILRYPKGKEDITGYTYEPWHYRYLGVEVATKVKEAGITYEEYYAYYIQKQD